MLGKVVKLEIKEFNKKDSEEIFKKVFMTIKDNETGKEYKGQFNYTWLEDYCVYCGKTLDNFETEDIYFTLGDYEFKNKLGEQITYKGIRFINFLDKDKKIIINKKA